MEPINKS